MTNPPSTFIPAKRRVGRTPRRTVGPMPVLVSGLYDFAAGSLTLAFDRAINIAGLAGGQITVNDPVIAGARFEATAGATLLGPTTIRLLLADVAGASGNDVTLSATPTNSVVAVDNGAAWAGVTDLELPFP
jgi:hypothetical protein